MATPIGATASAGYTFANWSATGGVAVFGNSNAASTTVTISAPTVVQANFTAGTNTPPVLAVGPPGLDYGTIAAGMIAQQSFYVTNRGGSNLVGTATVGAPFSVVTGTNYTLGAGQWQAVVVAYSPTGTGPHSNAVRFASNGGTNMAPVVGTSRATTAVLAVSPASQDFGATPVGTWADRSFYVTNTGGDVARGEATVGAPFSVVSGASYSLGANQGQAVVVRYSPTGTEPHSNSVVFSQVGSTNRLRSVTGTGTTNTTPVVGVVATDPTAGEPGTGQGTGTFTFTRSGSTATALAVGFSLGGTANPGTDYVAFPTSVTFAAGATTTNLVVTVLDDGTPECDETVVLTLNAGAGYTIGTNAAATVTIKDDDLPVVSVTATDATAGEPGSGQGTGTFTFTRTGCLTAALTANFTVGGTAIPGTDYTNNLGTSVTFPAGAATAVKIVGVIDDSLVEPTETVVVTLISGAGYALGAASSATVSILDDDPAGLALSVGSTSGAVGASVLVPVRANGFSNMLSMQFSMHWNPAVARLTAVEQFSLAGLGPANFNLTQTNNGQLTLSWFDVSGACQSLPNGDTLFALRFTLVGAPGNSTTLTIDGTPVAVELANCAGVPLPVTLNPGSLQILSTGTLAGLVHYYDLAKRVPGVTVYLAGGASQSYLTGTNGAYQFSVGLGANYTNTPVFTNDPTPGAGVTALDCALIQRHVLGITNLDSPYRLLAADVNLSSSVTSLDAGLIQQLVLGLTNRLPAGVWRFVPTNHVFANPAAPWGRRVTGS